MDRIASENVRPGLPLFRAYGASHGGARVSIHSFFGLFGSPSPDRPID